MIEAYLALSVPGDAPSVSEIQQRAEPAIALALSAYRSSRGETRLSTTSAGTEAPEGYLGELLVTVRLSLLGEQALSSTPVAVSE
jgi:hypothetical protein